MTRSKAGFLTATTDEEPALKIRARRPAFVEWLLNPYVQLVLGGILDAAGELLLKQGANTGAAIYGNAGIFGIAALGSFWTWLGVISYILGLFCWLYVLRFVKLSIAFPVITVLHTLVPIGAKVLLHENISLRRWMGIGLALAGVLLILKPVAKVEEKL